MKKKWNVMEIVKDVLIVNQLNEQLRAIRTQKAMLQKELKEEQGKRKYNQKRLMNLAIDIQQLSEEEEKLLRKLE